MAKPFNSLIHALILKHNALSFHEEWFSGLQISLYLSRIKLSRHLFVFEVLYFRTKLFDLFDVYFGLLLGTKHIVPELIAFLGQSFDLLS